MSNSRKRAIQATTVGLLAAGTLPFMLKSGPEAACVVPLRGPVSTARADLQRQGVDFTSAQQVDGEERPVTPANRDTNDDWSPVVDPTEDQLKFTIEIKAGQTAVAACHDVFASPAEKQPE